jgi:hypothetical protein
LRRLALIAALLLLAALPARAAAPVPGDSCAGQNANSFTWSGPGVPSNGGIVNGLFCNGGTGLYTGIINFQSTGNVGIDTTAPAAALDINGAIRVADTGQNCNSSSNGAVRFNSSTHLLQLCYNLAWANVLSGSSAVAGSDKQVQLNNNGVLYASSGLTFNSTNGNLLISGTTAKVGIGTASPTAALEVNGNIKNVNNTGGFYTYCDVANCAGWNSHGMVGISGGVALQAANSWGSGGLAGIDATRFFVSQLGVENFTVLQNGKVGIGTTSPLGALDVSSGGSMMIGADNGLSTRTNNTSKMARIVMPQYVNANVGTALMVGYTDGGTNEVDIGGSTGIYYAATQIGFWTAANVTTGTGTERVRIDSSGKVGIGTTSPGTALTLGSGQITVPDDATSAGNLAAPHYSFTGATDTGMYKQYAQNNIIFGASGADEFRVQNAGGHGVAITSAGGYYWNSGTSLGGAAGSTDTGLYRLSAAVVAVGNGTQGNHSGILVTGNVAALTADFTDANAAGLQVITGLSFTLPASVALNVPFECNLMYSQATTATSVSFGIGAVTYAPTRIDAEGVINTAVAGTTATAALANLTTTTATAIVSGTPGATATTYFVRLHGLVQNASNAGANTPNFYVSQATASKLVTVKAGSWCKIW